MTDGFRFFGRNAGHGLMLSVMAVASMAMAPAPALANASAAATAEMKAPVRESADIPTAGSANADAQFKQLFATWKTVEKTQPVAVASGITIGSKTAAKIAATASIPSRLPIEGSRFSSLYGSRIHPVTGGRKNHDGIDMAAPSGTPIYATADGTVEMAQWYGGYGNYVQLAHGGSYETRYGHMSRMNVSAGQQVKKGDLIGWVGSTGRSTGAHLHYEVRIGGQSVDPMPYLKGESFRSVFADASLGKGGPE